MSVSAGRRITPPRALAEHTEPDWPALAASLRIPFVDDLSQAVPVPGAAPLAADAVRKAPGVLVRIAGRTLLVAAPEGDELLLLRRRLGAAPELAERLLIAPPDVIRSFLVAHRRAALAHYAVHRLVRVLPSLSAARGSAGGVAGHRALMAAFLAAALVAPGPALAALVIVATLFFLNCSLWKLATAFGRPRQLRLEPLSDAQLPTYTVLVPLYREAAIVPDLIAHLARLDYPLAKLEILLIVEEADGRTAAALARHARGPLFRMVTVPPRGPRTKPKALTYALAFARGDNVVVFDAEDRPEPDQLRRAAAAFAARPGLGCVQARLAPDNCESFLARMFTVEYAANFEILLPTLSSFGVPLPLGGTSNHFPRAVLERVGAWDPYNVTEDADLGIRLARFGFASATIVSRTYEEAPVRFRQWLPQRRRWIKGWMQTVAVALGRGIAPGLRLPLRQQLAVHGVLTAGVLGLLLYPFSVGMVAGTLATICLGERPSGWLDWALLSLNAFNLAAVLVSAAFSSLRGLKAAGRLRLAAHVPLLPFYWALMSFAAWQALFQFYRRPSAWEKTRHGIARDRRAPRPPRFY